jgi:hypothetical protein
VRTRIRLRVDTNGAAREGEIVMYAVKLFAVATETYRIVAPKNITNAFLSMPTEIRTRMTQSVN